MSTGSEVVGGIVVMRTGENAREVIQRVKAKIAQVQSSLPEGVAIKPFYDRSELIDRSLDTLKQTLMEEIILVTLAHIIFLFHFRSILIVTLPLPVSILVSFTPEAVRHHVEYHVARRHRHRHWRARGRRDRPDGKCHPPLRRGGAGEGRPGLPRRSGSASCSRAAQQVGRPIFFAMAIIILAFVPVFALTGQEGKLFHPLALTKTFAMVGAALLAITLVPAFAPCSCAGLIAGRIAIP